MFFKGRIYWVLVLLIILGCNLAVSADTSHEVSIRVAEIGRYRVENRSIIAQGNDMIQTIDVTILSNTDRKWRFVAVPSGDGIGMEWSTDNRNWNSFETEETIILSGTKSDWRNYRFYVKVSDNSGQTKSLGYQLLFNE